MILVYVNFLLHLPMCHWQPCPSGLSDCLMWWGPGRHGYESGRRRPSETADPRYIDSSGQAVLCTGRQWMGPGPGQSSAALRRASGENQRAHRQSHSRMEQAWFFSDGHHLFCFGFQVLYSQRLSDRGRLEVLSIRLPAYSCVSCFCPLIL